jgi:hypothetical protein
MKGSNDRPGWRRNPAYGQVFRGRFCTLAHWNEQGEIVEENLFYDAPSMMKQIGLAQ